MCARERQCVCVCVCVQTNLELCARERQCVCVCVCVQANLDQNLSLYKSKCVIFSNIVLYYIALTFLNILFLLICR